MARRRVPAEPEPLEALLRRVPFFADLDRVDAARLVGALEKLEVAAETDIVSEGEQADVLYLVESGTVNISIRSARRQRRVASLEGPSYFGELGLLLDRRTSTARAATPVRLWRLPRHRYEQLVREHPPLGLAVATSAVEMLESRQRDRVGAPAPAAPVHELQVELAAPVHSLRRRLLGAVVAVVVPLLLWRLGPPPGLDGDGWHVALIGLGATIAWLFEPLPDFVIALLMAAAWGFAGLAPLRVSLNGFSSSSWFLALGALALAVAMARSGLLFRCGLLMLRVFPASLGGQVAALAVGGVLLTPLVPLQLPRVAAAAPLAREIAQALGFKPRSRGSAALAFAGLLGYGLFGSVFLTGLLMNFFVLSLLPAAERAHYDWLHWLQAAWPAGAVMLAGGLVAVGFLFRPEPYAAVDPEVLRRQRVVLGPMGSGEWMTLAALCLLLGGFLLQPLLHFDTAWVAVGVLAVAVAAAGIDREGFRAAIDWGFLIFFGVMLGTSSVLKVYGVDRWLGSSLVGVAHAVGNPALMLMLIALLVVVIRHTLSWFPEATLLTLALVPVAQTLGLSPWVVGFTILLAAETSPSDLVQVIRDVTRGDMFSDAQANRMTLALTAVVLLAIAASIPYWWATGILTR